jgi:hypothetical protein
VAEPCNGEALARQRTIAVVLRLVTGPGGELSHGEIVDPAGRVGARFPDWEALVPALRAWLEREGRQ